MVKKNMMIVSSKPLLLTEKNQQMINDKNINSENSVRLLRLVLDSKLNSNKHITQLCKKVSVS